MEEVLSAALILVACISGGISCMFIARSRSVTNKHSRQRIKEMESDIRYLTENQKQEAKDYRKEIMRLKVVNTKQQDGLTTITDKDMKNSGLGEVIMQMIPSKYRKAASFLVPQVERAIKDDPTILDRVYEKIKSANSTNSQQTESGSQTQGIQTL